MTVSSGSPRGDAIGVAPNPAFAAPLANPPSAPVALAVKATDPAVLVAEALIVALPPAPPMPSLPADLLPPVPPVEFTLMVKAKNEPDRERLLTASPPNPADCSPEFEPPPPPVAL